MSHIHVEHLNNFEAVIEPSKLCEATRIIATGMQAIPTAGIRVRDVRVDHYEIAGGNPGHGFVDIPICRHGGRTPTINRHAAQSIFEIA